MKGKKCGTILYFILSNLFVGIGLFLFIPREYVRESSYFIYLIFSIVIFVKFELYHEKLEKMVKNYADEEFVYKENWNMLKNCLNSHYKNDMLIPEIRIIMKWMNATEESKETYKDLLTSQIKLSKD